jgi:hypothetical protein
MWVAVGPCVYLARHMLIKAPVPDSNAVRLVSRVPDVVLCENEVPHEAVRDSDVELWRHVSKCLEFVAAQPVR